jgi:hypothetical protein
MNAFAERCLLEMSTLWHTSRTAVAGQKDRGKYPRLLWCAKWFSEAHKEFTPTSAYKAFDRMLALGIASNDEATIKFINSVIDDYDRKHPTP